MVFLCYFIEKLEKLEYFKFKGEVQFMPSATRYSGEPNDLSLAGVRSFSMVVDYDRSMYNMLQHYPDDSIPSSQEKSFQAFHKPTLVGKHERRFKLIRLGLLIYSDQVNDNLTDHNLRPADVWELLQFGIKFPKEPAKGLIKGLGSIKYTPYGLEYPYLGYTNDHIACGTNYWSVNHTKHARFLFVKMK